MFNNSEVTLSRCARYTLAKLQLPTRDSRKHFMRLPLRATRVSNKGKQTQKKVRPMRVCGHPVLSLLLLISQFILKLCFVGSERLVSVGAAIVATARFNPDNSSFIEL